jgi:phosphatidylethanolamine/phosphatidyl-N-methylethanolamine N-methyltransferase
MPHQHPNPNSRISTSHVAHSKRALRRHFIAAWLRAPLKMGAVLPSSRALARAIAQQVDPLRPGLIVELGAGTGVITHALIEAELPKERLLIIERERSLYGILHATFADLRIVCADALELEDTLSQEASPQVNAIVSSLPLISMPTAIRRAVEEQMARAIGGDGIIVQFTYGPKSPITPDELKRYGLVGRRVKIVLGNIPPAQVWVYRRG